MKRKIQRFVLTLHDDLHELLKEHAINRNLSMGSYIRHAIIYYIKNYKEVE